jgi:hypothetical protein
MVWVATQVGDFMSVVTGGKCGRFKKRHLGLLLGKKKRVKKGKKLERPFFVGPRNKK